MRMKNSKEQYQQKTNIHHIVLRTAACYHLSTQTFPKNIIVNHLLNGEKRRKSKRLPTQRRKNRSAICNDVLDKIGHVDRVQHRLDTTQGTLFLIYFLTVFMFIKELAFIVNQSCCFSDPGGRSPLMRPSQLVDKML